MDLISPEAYQALNMPWLCRLLEESRTAVWRSIDYRCGNPSGKWDITLSAGADAVDLEGSKKSFEIDIEDVVDEVQGRCTLMGNLDAVGVLQDGTVEQLRAEIAGQRNGGRFIVSLGSPVTSATPVERARLYCDLAHELGTVSRISVAHPCR